MFFSIAKTNIILDSLTLSSLIDGDVLVSTTFSSCDVRGKDSAPYLLPNDRKVLVTYLPDNHIARELGMAVEEAMRGGRDARPAKPCALLHGFQAIMEHHPLRIAETILNTSVAWLPLFLLNAEGQEWGRAFKVFGRYFNTKNLVNQQVTPEEFDYKLAQEDVPPFFKPVELALQYLPVEHETCAELQRRYFDSWWNTVYAEQTGRWKVEGIPEADYRKPLDFRSGKER